MWLSKKDKNLLHRRGAESAEKSFLWFSLRLCGGICFCLFLLSCQQYPTGGPNRLHNDMVDQPSFRPQRDPRPLPEGGVPVPDPETSVLYSGKRLFTIYCSPCHGASGRGDGPVAAKMVKPADITSAKYITMKDDFFYNVIRNGSGLMPPYAESLSSNERWQVVNYVRRLQKP